MEKSKIVKLFEFTQEIKNIYDFLDKYTTKINNYLNKKDFTDEQLTRYMLIGLLPEYRGCVHRGENFSTKIISKINTNKTEKFLVFNKYFGKEIENTREYINNIYLNEIHEINENILYKFVITGEI